MSILLVPATRMNLEKSIEKPVNIKFARKYLHKKLLEDLLRQSANEGIRCWAVTKNKRKLYDDTANGDEVLLTEKGTGLFTHYGIVIGKTQNVSFGKSLWTISGANPREYIYFLANIQKIRIDKRKLVNQLGYQESFTVPSPVMAKDGNYEASVTISKEYRIPVFDYIAENNENKDFSASNIQSSGTRRQEYVNFSKEIKKNYNYMCAVCGITETEFLIARHISTWTEDKDNRLNPSNGLCLCPLHDKAFEYGYISLDDNYEIIIKETMNKDSILFNELNKFKQKQILIKQIIMQIKYLPDIKLLQNHRKKHNL